MRVPCRDGTSMLGQRPAFESRLSPKPAIFFFNDTVTNEIYTLFPTRRSTDLTNNIDDRLKRHNAGQERYTKTKVPWKLFWFIQVPSRSEAMRLERNIKNLKSRKRILEFIRGKGNHSDIL